VRHANARIRVTHRWKGAEGRPVWLKKRPLSRLFFPYLINKFNQLAKKIGPV
jgi:hypothetical protein